MKILFVANTLFPSHTAHSLSVFRLCSAFEGQGHSIKLLGHKSELYTDNNSLRKFYGVNNEFTVRLTNPLLGERMFRFKRLQNLRRLFMCMAVADEIKRYEPELIYVRNVSSTISLVFSLLPCGLCPPIVCEMHNPRDLEKGGVLARVCKSTLRRLPFRKIVTNTRRLRDHLHEKIGDIVKVETAYLSAPDPKKALNGPVKADIRGDYAFNVGYVGNLDVNNLRGTQTVLELAGHFVDSGFHLVGGNNETVAYWSNLSQAYDNIFFYGRKPQNDIPGYLNAFDVVLNPLQLHQIPNSAGFHKCTFPLKIIDYLANECVLMVSDVPGHSELLEHNVNAYKVPATNRKAWIDSLVKLRENESLRKKLSRNARDTYERCLTDEARIEKILS